jgi:protein TonB
MTRRFWFVTLSFVLHGAAGIAIFATGGWNLERLDRDQRALATLAVLSPPPPPPGGGMNLPEQKVNRPPKRVVKVITQPPVKPKEPEKDTATTTTAAITDGTPGPGPGGPGTGDNPLGTCTQEPCGEGEDKDKPVAPPPPKPKTVTITPDQLTMMRTSGTTQIHPSESTKIQMDHQGKYRTVGVVKVCVSETGAIQSVSLLQTTKFPDYDQRLIDGVRGWRYRPFQTNGAPVSVCGTVTFQYNLAKR